MLRVCNFAALQSHKKVERLKVYHNLTEFTAAKVINPVMTTGTFDGVHLGHRVIIDRLNLEAKAIKGESVLLTFFPHPRMVLFPDDHGLQLLNSLDEKLALLKAAGIEHVIVQPFTKEFSKLSALAYVKEILVNSIGVKKMVVGYDHHFGNHREGNFDLLKEYALLYEFEVAEIPVQELNEVNVSSTKVRNALLAGDVSLANSFLSSNYQLGGVVKKGKQLGATIGFPTANIMPINDYKLIPAVGVYAVKVTWANETYNGMMNIGHNPTVENNSHLQLEVHILDFQQNIYGESITVTFFDRIRNEQKFDTLEALQQQLHHDKIQTLEMLQHT
ncbi:MAG: riboflavin kinase/FMN adenylyltransferase [Flavobacteriales bacterium]|jgi:riboflavin kinase/FMN adenylyltransferase